ncbi:TraY domain-containing protein [Yersinia kristensenii]|uniref:TraY domain-containing protein n=1 Tax=Yersinia kristensenii TaxID=28152 RepID=UPI000C1E757E|nr:TraY domain-containing protein [Yersinia kristensenii]PJE81967.1 TraYfamily protein [Yersinia kristensenii]
MNNDDFKKVGIAVDISAEMNRLLTQAAARSKRTKTTEAYIRLEDHLKNFPDIATAGRRFREDGTKG